MRRLYKKQKQIIFNYAKDEYEKGDFYMFKSAWDMPIHDELNSIHCFETMDSFIENEYQKAILKLTGS